MAQSFDQNIISETEFLFEIIAQIRNLRNSHQISPKEKLQLMINSDPSFFSRINASLCKIANLEQIIFEKEKPDQSYAFVVQSKEFCILTNKKVDQENERENLQKELDYTKGFLATVNKKLSNERFVNNAPEQVLITERKKKTDAEAKIEALVESLRKR
jgi:valyl-tRNA synthetase